MLGKGFWRYIIDVVMNFVLLCFEGDEVGIYWKDVVYYFSWDWLVCIFRFWGKVLNFGYVVVEEFWCVSDF